MKELRITSPAEMGIFNQRYTFGQLVRNKFRFSLRFVTKDCPLPAQRTRWQPLRIPHIAPLSNSVIQTFVLFSHKLWWC